LLQIKTERIVFATRENLMLLWNQEMDTNYAQNVGL